MGRADHGEVGLEAGQQSLSGLLALSERRRGHKVGGVAVTFVVVVTAVHSERCNAGVEYHHQPLLSVLLDDLHSPGARGTRDVERQPDLPGQTASSPHRLLLHVLRVGQQVTLWASHSLSQQSPLVLSDHVAILSVDLNHAAELLRLLHDSQYVLRGDHQLVLEGHEDFEGVDAVVPHQHFHLLNCLLSDAGDRHGQ